MLYVYISEYAAYYLRVMDKSMAKPGYAQKESDRLAKILKGGNTTPQKSDQMTIKRNILSVFLGADVLVEAHDEL